MAKFNTEIFLITLCGMLFVIACAFAVYYYRQYHALAYNSVTGAAYYAGRGAIAK